MKIADIFTGYLRHSQATNLHGPEALAQRQYVFDLFAALCGDREIGELKAFHLEDFIERKPDWRRSATKKAKANQINAAINWAVKSGRIPNNPLKFVNFAQGDPRPCLQDTDFFKILDRAGKPFAEALEFLRLTGCRLSDLCRLTWDGVDIERELCRVDNHKSRKKTGKPKIFALVPEAVALLQVIKCRPWAKDDGPVFLNRNGAPWTRQTLGQNFSRIKKRLKLGTAATLHGIRHQFGTNAIRNGAPLKTVSLQLGHASTAITEKYYVHLDGEADLMRLAATLANTLDGDAAKGGLQGMKLPSRSLMKVQPQTIARPTRRWGRAVS